MRQANQMKSSRSKPRKVAIALEMHWGHKRHQETYAGCLNYANEAGWNCVITPNSERVLQPKKNERPFDGVLARASKSMAQTANKLGLPIVNVGLTLLPHRYQVCCQILKNPDESQQNI